MGLKEMNRRSILAGALSVFQRQLFGQNVAQVEQEGCAVRVRPWVKSPVGYNPKSDA